MQTFDSNNAKKQSRIRKYFSMPITVGALMSLVKKLGGENLVTLSL